ncbi:MAG: FAD-dependent monooxygenase, partial [Acinetobacter sp.]|nr:FAD-dependent monooxygenase [Acinetobacter sp.]
WLESAELFPFVWARNFGLKQVEQLNWFKDRFMRQANGFDALEHTSYAC